MADEKVLPIFEVGMAPSELLVTITNIKDRDVGKRIYALGLVGIYDALKREGFSYSDVINEAFDMMEGLSPISIADAARLHKNLMEKREDT